MSTPATRLETQIGMEVAQVAWAISHTTIRIGLHFDRSRPETGSNSAKAYQVTPLPTHLTAPRERFF